MPKGYFFVNDPKMKRNRTRLSPMWAGLAALLALTLAAKEDGQLLPGAKPLTLEGDLAERMLDGAHRYLDRKLQETERERAEAWKAGKDRPQFQEEARKELGRILGTQDARTPFEAPSLVSTTKRPARVAKGAGYEVFVIRWPTLEGTFGEGLLLEPVGRKPTAEVVALPDADQTPEAFAGLEEGTPPAGQFARRLAEAGCRVVVPALVNRTVKAHHARRKRVKMSYRELLHRSAFLMGRTLQGYEIQKALAAVDWFAKEGEEAIGIAGWGEGGMLALRAAALDERIKATWVSGHFGAREGMWREPLERNVFGFLNLFGDAELAAMVMPRKVLVEACAGPEVTINAPGAAPGSLSTNSLQEVRREIERAKKLAGKGDGVGIFASGKDGKGPAGESGAGEAFVEALTGKKLVAAKGKAPKKVAPLPDPEARHERCFREIDGLIQRTLDKSHLVRSAAFKVELSSLDAFAKSATPHRKRFEEEVIGLFKDDFLPLSPRSRKVFDKPLWTGHEVTLDVHPDLFAFGILLVPKGMKKGERRPVVVCQHGLEGRPRDVIEGDHRAYHDFAAKLCEKGYVVFAPQNPYLMLDKFRSLQRKANPLGRTLFTLIVAQHRQIVRWLAGLPFVDPDRIAFYGLSYGGKTAMRVPALVEEYCLSICSADFNEWVRKTASTRPGDDRYTYPFTIEYEIFEFDLGHTFNYAEMAGLIAPRPFMVERGHFDGVAPDEWVGAEYAKVRRLYARLGIGERTDIEWFVGPHTINGQGTFRFLDKWLDWPPEKD